MRYSCLILLCCMTMALACQRTSTEIMDNGLPNIVWLVSEDNSKHFLKLYDQRGAPMPNLENFARKSLVFNHAFSNSPVCSVARSTLISGCYAPRVGAQYHRKIEPVPLPQGLRMFPYYLNKQGYYTTNNAKEDYNFVKGDTVWDESSRKASYRNRPEGAPFFHVQNFGVTHEGQLHFSEEEMNRDLLKVDTSGIEPFPYHANTPITRYTYKRQLLHQQKLDSLLGSFLRKLEAEGLMENTIIFYYGDHGGVLPRSKGYLYESGLHIPLVVYFPEKFRHLSPAQAGERLNGFVSFVDFAPTVLHLAGIKVPGGMDGRPFLGPDISRNTLETRNTAIGYADRFDEKYDLVRSIRRDRFKYIRHYQPFNPDALHNFYRYKMLAYDEWRNLFQQGKLNEVQSLFFLPKPVEALYNLEEDPHELRNLALEPQYRDTLLDLRRSLQATLKKWPDLSFYPEPHFLMSGSDNPTNFGQTNEKAISRLIDIADWMLLPFPRVQDSIGIVLRSGDTWQKYWAWIVCSSFGSEAKDFESLAREMAGSQEHNLVRMRALEFLFLLDQTLDYSLFGEILQNSTSMAEANLLLNSIAMMMERNADFKLPDIRNLIAEAFVKEDRSLVPRRLEYFAELMK